MAEVYIKGWENAKLEIYNEEEEGYIPVACITGVSDTNTNEFKERVNVCTEGKVKKTVEKVTHSLAVTGDVVTENSYNDLKDAQVGKVYMKWTKGVVVKFMEAWMEDLSLSAPADGDATFSMTIGVIGEFSDTSLVPEGDEEELD